MCAIEEDWLGWGFVICWYRSSVVDITNHSYQLTFSVQPWETECVAENFPYKICYADACGKKLTELFDKNYEMNVFLP